jgi:hypothetical protein
MEQSQLETIDTICQNMQLMASVLQEFVREKKQNLFPIIKILLVFINMIFFPARSIPNVC